MMSLLFRIVPLAILVSSSAALLAEEAKPQATPAQRAPRPQPAGVKVLRDIDYVPGGGKSRTLDLYIPENADAPLPLVVGVHGGGWSAGNKESGAAVKALGADFVTASINYRLSQEAVFPAQIEDCKAAIRFLRGHAKEYHIDPGHIGVWGSSAGGHLVALLGTSGGVKELEGNSGDLSVSSRVQAVCDWFGPTDFSQIAAQAGPDAKFNVNGPQSAMSRLLGGPLPGKLELAKLANPITFVKMSNPPFLIMHGDRDPVVPIGQSKLLDAALKAAGVDSTFFVVEGAGHGDGFQKPELLEMVRAFFVKHLQPSK